MNTSGVNTLSAEQLIAIMDEIPYTVIVANPDGKFVFWNKLAYSLFKKDLVTSSMENWVEEWGCYNLDRTTHYKTENLPLARALRGEVVKNEKMYLQTIGRQGLYLEIDAYPIFNADGTVQVGVVMCKDITAEQLLYSSVIHQINELKHYLQHLVEDNIIKNQSNEIADKKLD